MTDTLHTLFDKKTSGNGIKTGNILNKELAGKLYKPIIRTFKKRKVHSPFIYNICRADLADMQLIRKFNKGIRFLLCAIYIQNKYAWFIPLKYKKVLQLLMLFKNFLNESKLKPNKIWVDKAANFIIDE